MSQKLKEQINSQAVEPELSQSHPFLLGQTEGQPALDFMR